jgi:hypothetical protein
MSTNEQSPNQTNAAKSLQAAYSVMSADKNREAEADEWCEALFSEAIEDGW